MNTGHKLSRCILPLLLIIALLLPTAAYAADPEIPDFSGAAVIELNHGVPAFSEEDAAAAEGLVYSELDALGRPGPACALLSRETLTVELRDEDGEELPVGWQKARYDDVIPECYLYSICCLVSPALGGSGTDMRNVFTGTRYLRTEGMQPFEDLIAGLLLRTNYHILYRATPVYRGEELVPMGVQLEACSVEDGGRSVRFNVLVYNVQPGISIDYRTGDSRLDGKLAVNTAAAAFVKTLEYPPLAEMETPKYGSFDEMFAEYQKSAAAAARAQQASADAVTLPGTVFIPNNPFVDYSQTGKKYHKSRDDSGDYPKELPIEEAAALYEPCHSCWSGDELAILESRFG